MTLQSMDAGEADDHAVDAGSTSDLGAEPLADEGSLTFEAPVEGSALARTWKLMPRALGYLKGHRIKGVALVVVTGLGAVVTLAEPWPLAFVIDTVLKDRPPPAWITNIVGTGTGALILFAVLAMLGIALLAGGTLVIERYLSTNINLRATLDFRSDLIRHLQRLSLAYHDDNRTGVLLFRVNQQAPGLGQMLVALPDLGQSFLTVVGMAIVVFLINVHVAELALFVVPIIYYSTVYYANRIEPRLLRVRGMEAMNLNIVHESLSMFRVIAAFGRESDHYERFRRQGDATVATRVHVTVLQVLFQLAVNFVTSVGTAAVLGVGAYEVVEGRMSAGELVVVMAYVASVYQPLESLTFDLTGSAAGHDLVRALLADPRRSGRRDREARRDRVERHQGRCLVQQRRLRLRDPPGSAEGCVVPGARRASARDRRTDRCGEVDARQSDAPVLRHQAGSGAHRWL